MAAITLKTESQIAKMREAGRLTYLTLKLMGELMRPGITTKELDKAAYEFMRDNGAKPSFLDYNGYPASICASVNEQVVHGIPGEYELKDGDIVSIDVGAYLNGWHGDAARTFIVGEASPAVKKLVEVTKECFFEGLKMCVAGNELSAVSAAIQNHAERAGYGVVRELVGHGIGRRMHEEPEVPNFTDPHFPRVRLHAGMTIAIEPMINMGRADVRMLRDGWTVIAADRKPSAHYENTVAITEAGPVILTAE